MRSPRGSSQEHRSGSLSPPEVVRRFFASRGKHVLSFAGFGELGYEQAGIVERVAEDALSRLPRESVMVQCGTLLRVGGEDGIAGVFAVAHRLGIETAGIHPGVALEFASTHRVSPHEDSVFFVHDDLWGGFVDHDGRPSATLALILEVSDELVAIGGGKHAADELRAFRRAGKPVRYVPAEMNRRAVGEWCARTGVERPDVRGAAYEAWLERTDAEP